MYEASVHNEWNPEFLFKNGNKYEKYICANIN